MRRRDRLLLTVRTARHLRPEQVGHRVRLRLQRRAVQAAPTLARRLLTTEADAATGWPAGFVPLDARLPSPTSVDQLERGEITLLGQTRPLDDWRSTEPPQLWRYHLHYWDWAWCLVQDDDPDRGRRVFAQLLRSWQEETRFGHWDEWSPYVVALRAWSWCGLFETLAVGTDVEDELRDLIALHAGYLRTHLELDVGGNHLVKDLKGLIGCAVFLGDEQLLRTALGRLRRQVARQVLPDGGHEERAPAYHCQVLGDLIDVAGLLGSGAPGWLVDAVAAMRRFLGLVLLPDGSVPLLNDGYPVAPELLALLDPGQRAPEGLTLLPDSGLAVLRRGEWHLLADVGPPCPDDLPAHAHADTLGFLLHHGPRRLVGERFTSTYVPGPMRAAERGTQAHSTVQVDGVDSTEVWGAFRAGRRAGASVRTAHDDGQTVVLCASHDGYRHLPGRPVHVRTWELSRLGVQVRDDVLGSGEHDVAVRFHGTPASVVTGASVALQKKETCVAIGWEERRKAAVLEHTARATLPWHYEVTLTRENV